MDNNKGIMDNPNKICMVNSLISSNKDSIHSIQILTINKINTNDENIMIYFILKFLIFCIFHDYIIYHTQNNKNFLFF